ncbi:LysR family transcriptional regulator [Shewanella sp. WXL01]|uniref:LysR family transcriptional regulator n=1 Tax=Shewanella sp. WXL01 TaxID=2709721 RepID=UPI00143851BA|nr:LysR family transcriptional regulator [Shewanella sp. WXL01]NKF50866.1 LysR family transcriptional regulator [Shewanella sp. WXL01]
MSQSREHKKFERLFLFSEVAKQLSFTEAAANLGISRGYLSEQIKQLEQDFGRPLLVRSTRSVKLTEQGQQVLSSMGQVKSQLIDLERQIRHDHQTIAGDISITAPSQFTARFLLPICQQFHRQYSLVNFKIDTSYTQHDLNQSDFDIAFRATTTPPQNMVAKKLFDYRHVCCASPAYIAKHGAPQSVDDLVNHQCLTTSDQANWQLDEEAINVSGAIAINDNHMLKSLALDAQGIILVAEYLVDKELNSGQLQTVLTGCDTMQSSSYLLHPQLIHQSARLKLFIEFVQQQIGLHSS